jgi:hypothetical protein
VSRAGIALLYGSLDWWTSSGSISITNFLTRRKTIPPLLRQRLQDIRKTRDWTAITRGGTTLHIARNVGDLPDRPQGASPVKGMVYFSSVYHYAKALDS